MPKPAQPRDHHDARRDATKRARAEACAAVERMWATRPLTPPPLRADARAPTAGQRAAARDARLGLIDTGNAPFLESIDDE